MVIQDAVQCSADCNSTIEAANLSLVVEKPFFVTIWL